MVITFKDLRDGSKHTLEYFDIDNSTPYEELPRKIAIRLLLSDYVEEEMKIAKTNVSYYMKIFHLGVNGLGDDEKEDFYKRADDLSNFIRIIAIGK